MRRFVWLIFVVLIIVMLTGCGKQAEKSEMLKAGFVYVGPVEDAGWTKSHDLGRLGMEELDYVEESVFVESVPEGAEAVRVITELVESGCDMIFTTSFGYMDPTLEVAKKYPDVYFHHCSGYKTHDNMTNFFGKMYQDKYLAGIVAAKMSESGKLGYVAPFPIPEVVRLINAYTLGAKSVNPDVTVQVLWTNSWFDPVHEKEAANSMIADGCDVITQGTDSAGPQEAAEAAGLYSIGYDSDMKMYAPTAHLTASVWNWALYYRHIAESIKNDTWTNEGVWWGIETGIVDLSDYNEAVPQDVRDLVAAEKARIIENDDIFTGPLSDNEGNLRVEEGVALTAGEKLSIQWFVDGVLGQIPKAGEGE